MKKSSFQEIILKLQSFWADHGCLIWQPYYSQVGAGTMNPATFLRVLGPEPWNVAYVEPSVRPDDGRYGENPNRFQVHYQYQVILKPDTGDPQELYLDSLKAIGIDPRQHDIRFVEDNWEQPAISAWGLGWEVWLDGQEITQFTYFQQVGGQALDPVAVELTYGLERILIALNNAAAIWDEEWGPGITYGEVRRLEEYEHSKYYFEVADVEAMRAVFERYESECSACLEQGLVLPAYDYVLKCSHTFNILDTRGAIGVTERQVFFRRVRELARRVAEGYLEQRKTAEYPLLKDEGGRMKAEAKSSVPLDVSSAVTKPSDFVLEIGVEELPANDVDWAVEQLGLFFEQKILQTYSLKYKSVRVYGTPRRLVVYVEGLDPQGETTFTEIKGPPESVAFDKDGKPTQALFGWLRKNEIPILDEFLNRETLVQERDGGRYVIRQKTSEGSTVSALFPRVLPVFMRDIKFDKTMRWNDSGVSFSRPIRWFVALHGETVIPFEYAGVTSGDVTRGLRPYDSPEIRVPSAEKYFDVIRAAGILLDKAERKASILEQVRQAAELVGGEAIIGDVGAIHESPLLNEVANLVEMPTAVMGGFNQEFLSLPEDVLISVMKKHQRYFPVRRVRATDVGATSQGRLGAQANPDGSPLLPYFIAIRNGDDLHIDLVRQGNEHVLGARFADANFFVREDIKQPLDAFRPKLSGLIFQTKLGSMLDKSERMLKLSAELADMLALSDVERANVQRSTFLAKADLVTKMVTEMTSLQGIIGREYALRSGEDPAVAAAIGEQYQPVPKSKVGVVLALADRLDSLVGLFAAGLAPTGAKDPFGLRRAAIGTVQPLIEHGIDFDLRVAVDKAAALQPIPVSDEVKVQVLDFITGRLSVVLKETYRYDVVDAVLAEQSANPAAAARAVKQLQAWVGRADWSSILPGYARCVRIIRSAQTADREPWITDPNKFVEKEEKDLFSAYQSSVAQAPASVDEFLNAITTLIPAINDFFDKVLVMAEDETVRLNRLALVGKIARLADGIADLSRLEGF